MCLLCKNGAQADDKNGKNDKKIKTGVGKKFLILTFHVLAFHGTAPFFF